jgi:SagB-type dehydrogenase family enzyme
VLRAATAAGAVEIGPRFLPGHTACSDCFRHGRTDAGLPAPSPPHTAAGLLLAGLATAEAFALLSGAPAQAAPSLRVTSPDGRRDEQFLCVPRPECGCDDTGGGGPQPDLVDIQLGVSEHSAPDSLPTGTPSAVLRQQAMLLVAERPPFHAHPRHPLPPGPAAVSAVFGDAPPPRALLAPGVDVLASLLARTAGLRPDPGGNPWQRWAPTGGQLASVELYLATRPGVPRLPGTLFRYDDLRHALMPLRTDTPGLGEVLAGTDLPPDGLDAVLVLTAAHRRVAAKYRDFAYRLTHLDAGCAATQLAAAASGHGLGVRFATRWDESLAEMLDLTPGDQYVTAVAGLHRGETCR